jgi:hypothetical protein
MDKLWMKLRTDALNTDKLWIKLNKSAQNAEIIQAHGSWTITFVNGRNALTQNMG